MYAAWSSFTYEFLCTFLEDSKKDFPFSPGLHLYNLQFQIFRWLKRLVLCTICSFSKCFFCSFLDKIYLKRAISQCYQYFIMKNLKFFFCVRERRIEWAPPYKLGIIFEKTTTLLPLSIPEIPKTYSRVIYRIIWLIVKLNL